MAIREAFLMDKNTGEIVNKIIIDDELAYAPDAGLILVFPKNENENKTMTENFNEYVAE